MDIKVTFFRFSIFFLLIILILVFACSTPSWFPIKKGPPHKAKMKELLDKEVVIIDREEYVKVLNPRNPEKGDQPKYFYIPVDEYLSKKETFTTSAPRAEGIKEELPLPSTKPVFSSAEKEITVASPLVSRPANLKKKVAIAYFDDRNSQSEEVFGDWLAEKLIQEVNQTSQQVLFVDYQAIKEFMEKKGIPLADLETTKVLYLLNEVFGIHALLIGELAGPYVFTTKAMKDQDGTATAIIKIEMRLVDTFSGKTLKKLSVNNPVIGTKERGSFSEEKAKMKAFHLTIAELSRLLSKDFNGLDWFCRVAKVDGDEVYINAGKVTGLQVGDVMEVFYPISPGETGEVKGKIQILDWFGIDASIGKLIQGKKPEVNDILKMAKSSSYADKGK